MSDATLSLGAGLDVSHKQAVALGGVGATGLAGLALEMKRWSVVHGLIAQGFLPWDTAGMYVHAVAAQTLTFTVSPPQAPIVFTAVLAGVTVLYILAALARLDMHISVSHPLQALVLGVFLAAVTGVCYLMTTLPRPVLTVDLPNQVITVQPCNCQIALSAVSQFYTYDMRTGKSGHQELGLTTTDGQQEDLMALPSGPWEAQSMMTALTSFITSNGTAIAPR